MDPEELYHSPRLLAEYLEHCKDKARALMKARGVTFQQKGRAYRLGELPDEQLRSVIGPAVSTAVRQYFSEPSSATVRQAEVAPLAWVGADSMLHVLRATEQARERSTTVECKMPLAEFVMMMRNALFLGQYMSADANATDIIRGQGQAAAAKKGGLKDYGGDEKYQCEVYAWAWAEYLKMLEAAPVSVAAAAKRLAEISPHRKRSRDGDPLKAKFTDRVYKKMIDAEGVPG